MKNLNSKLSLSFTSAIGTTVWIVSSLFPFVVRSESLPPAQGTARVSSSKKASMKTGTGAVAVSSAASAAKSATQNKPICSADGQVVVYESRSQKPEGGVATDWYMAYCEKIGDMVQPEPRPLSRGELSQLYGDSRAEFKSGEEQTRFWKENLGVSFEQLSRKTDDESISKEALIYPGGPNRNLVLQAASWLKRMKGSTAPVPQVEWARNRGLVVGSYQYFMRACRSNGGTFTPIESAGEPTSVTADVIEESQNKVLCTCRGGVYSNPIDYKCDPSRTGPRFVELIPPSLAPPSAPVQSNKVKN